MPGPVDRRSALGIAARAATVVAAVAGLLLSGCGRAGVSPAVPLASFGELGLSPGQFAKPRAVDFDGSTLWVVDKSARVQRLDPSTGRCLQVWTMPESSNGKPVGLTAFAPAGSDRVRLFVADTHYFRVMVYDAPRLTTPLADVGRVDGPPTLLTTFGGYGKGDGQFVYVTDVAVAPTPDGTGVERLFVGEYGGNDRVSIWEPDGTGYRFVRSFGEWGVGDRDDVVEFNRPQGLVFDASRGELLVADSCNHRVGRFDRDGRLIAWIGSPETSGEAPGAFRTPYGLAPMHDGTVLVLEYGNARIQRIDLETGRSLASVGTRGSGPERMAEPWGVAADVSAGVVYALDTGNNRVVSWRAPGGAGGEVNAGAVVSRALGRGGS